MKGGKIMKKTLKKTLSLALALVMVFAISVTAFAAGGITKEDAQNIALKDAGYTAADVVYIKAEYDTDRGIEKWDVDFVVEADGLYKDYDYEIKAADGTILEKSWEYEDDYRPGNSFFYEIELIWKAFVAWLLSIFK